MITLVMLICFIVMILLTVPVAFAIGVSSIIGLLLSGVAPLMVVPQRLFGGADSFVLLAIPLLYWLEL